MSDALNFQQLVAAIQATHREIAAATAQAVNVGLTLRNWLIGCYIANYELAGSDRAIYGDRLFPRLAERLQALHVPGCDRRELYRYRDFFKCYPQIVGTLSPQSKALLPAITLVQEKVGTPSPLSSDLEERLLTRLSYSHLALLAEIANPDQRRFYEVEALRGQWSVRELKRQIGSLYYERSGLSTEAASPMMLPKYRIRLRSSATPTFLNFWGLPPLKPCAKPAWKPHCWTGYKISCSNSVMVSVSRRGKSAC
jgi:hypothetical protein